jgi:Na+/H+ antiporter NhaD/arsenite permease-like protein
VTTPYLLLLAAGAHPAWTAPFVALLLAIAILPLVPAAAHWWHRNSSKLLVASVLGAATLLYYLVWHGYHGRDPGLGSVGGVLHHALLLEYVPFIVLLFALYTIAGGIELTGDLPARPATNTAFLAVGGLVASFIGTTGAAMVLVRALIRTNSERKHVVHTLVFFIFIVCNCGGLLLPLGDPPLFLGYLRGVPFAWTLTLLREWALVNGLLLLTYYVWDRRAYAKETRRAVRRDETQVQRLRMRGAWNLALLGGVIACVALLDPNRPVPGTAWTPVPYLREGLMLGLAAASYFVPAFTERGLRERAAFDFGPIAEVACLFAGVFVTMQVPLEILGSQLTVASLGLERPFGFFWTTGVLSAVLDNAPTYVVFFETARNVPGADPPFIRPGVSEQLLAAVSCGAVFLGALTYIGNGPNFLVKAIAERAGVKMPSFFGYLKYSVLVLGPILAIASVVFFL